MPQRSFIEQSTVYCGDVIILLKKLYFCGLLNYPHLILYKEILKFKEILKIMRNIEKTVKYRSVYTLISWINR